MDIAKIVLLLKNSGFQNITVGNGIIQFDDPACIYTAFDSILNFAWVVIVFLTVLMLFGWAVLYIKNGVKINNLFNNAKTIILIFCILSAVKPIVNLVYRDNLFARGCARKQVSLTTVQELMEIRNKSLPKSAEDELYEIFEMTDSGVIYDSDSLYATENSSYESAGYNSGTFDNERNNIANSYDSYAQDSFSNSTASSNNYSTQTANTHHSSSGFIRAVYSNLVTIYINARGEKIKRSGGSAAWRNNNPGNIRKSKAAYSFGAIGETDKWAVFPDEETGLNAIVKLLQSKNYRNLSVKAAIHRWAPSSDGNNPESYARKVSKMTGLPADKTIDTLNNSELQKVANAIKTIEGWDVGKEEKL